MESSSPREKRPRRDRLSGLEDAVLGHVLSFLPTEEAARAAILSRRWRRTFAHVHTISFQLLDHDCERGDDETVDWGPQDKVTAALLARECYMDGDERLRCLRVAVLRYNLNSRDMNQWLSYALSHGVQELQLETPLYRDERPVGVCLCQSGAAIYSSASASGYCSDSDSDDDVAPVVEDYHVLAKLYSCATLRALHLASCSLSQLPSTVNLPSLETLALSMISDTSSGEDIQRLISGCPRLADLTLEACHITDITVAPEIRLRRFALRCCVSVRRVTLDLSEARALEYRGQRPDVSCFTLVDGGAPTRVALAKIDICATLSPEIDFKRLGDFLFLFVNAARLHLRWPNVVWDPPSEYDGFFAEFPLFHNLTRLELASRCTHHRVVVAVAGILRRMPNLTALSLELGGASNKVVLVDEQDVAVEVPKVPVPCLRERLSELNVEQYEGSNVQRRLLKWLLRGAPVVEMVRVVFANGGYSVLDELMNQIKRWTANPAATVEFL